MSNPIAVLTGDFVDSTSAEPGVLDRAMTELVKASEEINAWIANDTKFTRFRGDGWQIRLTIPSYALRAALFIMARLRAAKFGLSTRIAIGVGDIDNLGTDDLGDASGEAFEQSGRALDAMKRSQHLTIAGQGVTELHSVVVQLLDAFARRWTAQQAEAVALYLHPDNPTLNDLASVLGISSQAVSYRLKGAGGREIYSALKVWELNEELKDFATRQDA